MASDYAISGIKQPAKSANPSIRQRVGASPMLGKTNRSADALRRRPPMCLALDVGEAGQESHEYENRRVVSDVMFSVGDTAMKRMALAGFILTAVMLSAVPSSHAGPRHGPEVDFFIGVGPAYRYAPPPYYVYPPPYYVSPPPVVYSAPVVVPSPIYVTPPPPPAPAYWYYCPDYSAYYPSVPTCPQPWVPVPAR
jgi:hypothetical protein